MSMTVQVDVRPSGRISVAINTDAPYNPDCMDDMVHRAAALVTDTLAKVLAEWAEPEPE